MSARPRALLSWSSGKDAAWSLHVARQSDDVDIVGLFTTTNEEADRVAMHGVRTELLRQQASAAGLPLVVAGLPAPCPNDEYKARVGRTLRAAQSDLQVTHVAFGDLLLEDVRGYREKQMADLGMTPVFPVWKRDTTELAQQMIAAGLKAYITCVDTEQLDASFAGRAFDESLLADLPDGVDRCGENGEFHTLVTAGPMFDREIEVTRGEIHETPRFVYCDFIPVS